MKASLKKKLCPKLREPAIAKKDKNGNIVTTEVALNKLYEDTYKERLKPNEPKERLKNQFENKMKLFDMRIEEAKKNKTNL